MQVQKGGFEILDDVPFYPSHYNANTGAYQSNADHLRGTAAHAKQKCRVHSLVHMAELAGDLHDIGKYSDLWRQYFEANLHGRSRGGQKEDHSTSGGQLVEELIPHTIASAMIQTVVYSHHGLQDCISVKTDEALLDARKRKAEQLPVHECRDRFYTDFKKEDIEQLAAEAQREALEIRDMIITKLKAWEMEDPAASLDSARQFPVSGGGITETAEKTRKHPVRKGCYGSRDFYLGMFERLLMSLLIDADRRDTENFMAGGDICPMMPQNEQDTLWENGSQNLERYIAETFSDTGGVSRYKREISVQCRDAAGKPENRYLLSVPTGSGKTLASLRFALNHAKTYKKSRIIYVAPFLSITEQNAEQIRKALGMPDIVLEHHCNIILEEDEERAKYDRVTEDWQSPVVVTTAVQFLNTMFAGKTGNVRRFHSLCDSVIILDEVQALPVRVLGLFDLGINFLTEFAGAAAVLCTATQPLLGDLPENRLLPACQMVPRIDRYDESFRRTEITDDTELESGGMDADTLARYIVDKADQYESVLFICNTKSCARILYENVAELCGTGDQVWHLSTNMVPQNRLEILGEIKEYSRSRSKRQEDLNKSAARNAVQPDGDTRKKYICISTQLIEAGVDISFDCVIRSLAGLDNVIQAAGRCNRYSEIPVGRVFIVKAGAELEKISSLRDIQLAQQAMGKVLRQYRLSPASLDGRLDSRKAISMYYQYYFIERESEMSYPVTVEGVPTTLVRMLSGNEDLVGLHRGSQENRRLPVLRQAFKTAGDCFEVIEENGQAALVVEYNDIAKEKISKLEKEDISLGDRKKLLRELQLYTVSVSPQMLEKLKPGIRWIWDGQVMVLDGRYYDRRTGIKGEPSLMEAMIL